MGNVEMLIPFACTQRGKSIKRGFTYFAFRTKTKPSICKEKEKVEKKTLLFIP